MLIIYTLSISMREIVFISTFLHGIKSHNLLTEWCSLFFPEWLHHPPLCLLIIQIPTHTRFHTMFQIMSLSNLTPTIFYHGKPKCWIYFRVMTSKDSSLVKFKLHHRSFLMSPPPFSHIHSFRNGAGLIGWSKVGLRKPFLKRS